MAAWISFILLRFSHHHRRVFQEKKKKYTSIQNAGLGSDARLVVRFTCIGYILIKHRITAFFYASLVFLSVFVTVPFRDAEFIFSNGKPYPMMDFPFANFSSYMVVPFVPGWRNPQELGRSRA